ncbi:MAG: beta-ketoacyl synthase chain length factor [Deltaproteobacteria bacterium]|nr:beta-ketoacyl synthase chain length factor [Deltaproteobacteria bacterium]MBN2673289.1 beta-ketoacyl synthase chain length factor [Deltaproteobacteria bacterium]
MSRRAIQLLDWTGRAAGLEDRQTFRNWVSEPYAVDCEPSYKPPCKAVQARLRGKSSTLSRLVMEPFFELTERLNIPASDVDMVFASRFGEIQVLETLFESIFTKDTVSPLDFCNSVHHTATGYASIASKNQQLSRTVSANEQTFGAALFEAYALVVTGKSNTVMVLAADEKVPELFRQEGHCECSFGVALAISAVDACTAFEATGRLRISYDDVVQAYQRAESPVDWLRRCALKNEGL